MHFSHYFSHQHNHEAVQSLYNIIVEVTVSFVCFPRNVIWYCAAELFYKFFCRGNFHENCENSSLLLPRKAFAKVTMQFITLFSFA